MSLRWVWHLYNFPCVVIQEYSLALKVFNKNCENDFFLVQALCDTSVICSDQANSFLTSVNCVSNNRHQLSRTTSLIPSWRTSSSVVVRKLVICRNQNLIKISMAIEKNVWLKKSKSKEKFRSQRGSIFQMPPCSVWSPPFSPSGSLSSLVLLAGIAPNCFKAD